MLIKNILTLDLSEDIKNVIDLEDISETEIQTEIENYIVTDGLAKEYDSFVTTFTSNISETGVWISGFYGSGKSYFGKLLGYMISNRMIAGTPARDRIIQRFTGVNDEALIKNSITRLNSINSRVVFLDIAKQDTTKGLAFTLFRNFLKSLGLPENEHGFFLYHLMIKEKQININDFIHKNLNKNWVDLRSRLLEYSKAAKNIFINQGNSEGDYKNIIDSIVRDIDQFGANRLKEELNSYLQIVNDEKIVFLFDEASEAINQQKFSLLDLEGVSECLSALGGRVWAIAIAQEKLDDVINNSNVTKAQLTKVTDRFKTKIHLEATEVDVIIRNRLLKKNEAGLELLKENYRKNSGKISEHALLSGSGISKTDNLDSYSTYYPFFKYQFDLLQNFLFGTKGYASTKVAARGMIITTYDILKHQLQNDNLFEVVAGWQIVKEAQPQPPVRMVNRYENAERSLKEAQLTISGRKLLETIHFLCEAEVVPSTLPNIVKSFINESASFHAVQTDVSKALDILTEAKILLDTNKTYRITSDIEQRLLDEMNGFTVQGFLKKKQAVILYKSSDFIKALTRISDSNLQYDFYITTDNYDELSNPSLKYLKIKLKSVYEINENRTNVVETLRMQHQNDKDLIWVVPDNSTFKVVDKLIDEIERITFLEQKYNNPNSEEGKIMLSFSTQKSERQNRLKDLIEDSLHNSTALYLYNNYQLSNDNWQSILQTQQKQVIQNVYDKRLSSQLSDNVAVSVIKEANNTRLNQYFTTTDFKFFDAQGNFIGDNLKVVEEILYKTRNTFVEGNSLEKDLEQPPTGFAFGTVISSVAALMRAGKIMAKYNGSEKFSWRDEGVLKMFEAREFRKASFKAISKALLTSQKQDLAKFLLDIEVEKYINKKIDYNTNDFDLVNAIRDLSKHFISKVDSLRTIEKDFERLFPNVETEKEFLNQFSGAVSESNYIEKAVEFLTAQEGFMKAVQAIEKVEKFISTNLPKAKSWKYFIGAVNDELNKAANFNATIAEFTGIFNEQYQQDIVKNFASLQQIAQKIKDEYHKLFSKAMVESSAKYVQLGKEAEILINEINSLPAKLNDNFLEKVKAMLQYALQRTQPTIELDYDVKDKRSRFTYSEVLSFSELFGSKKVELGIIEASLIRQKPPEPVVGESFIPLVRTFRSQLPGTKIKVLAYKQWLQQELQKLASAADNDDIEINN